MPNTDQFWMQDTPFPDLEVFVGASEFKDANGNATIATAGGGPWNWLVPASQSCSFYADLPALLRRTGMYGSPNLFQTQFGTAASQPGPSLVAGTSDPEGIRGFPPYTASKMPTLVGTQTGPIPKGIQVNGVEVIYTVNTNPATLTQFGLTTNQFFEGPNPTTISIVTLGTNGLLATTGNHKILVPIASPAMITIPSTLLLANVRFTSPAGGTVNFHGCNFKCSYNFN